ncbi:MAG TPA: hypothetical protein VMU66_02920 [Gaiellales bacterium]|nr:hypothetical protein [Gaiellales bacterium]
MGARGGRPRTALVSWPLYRLLLGIALLPSVIAALTLQSTPIPPQPVPPLEVSGAAIVRAAAEVTTVERAAGHAHAGCCGPGSAGDLAVVPWMQRALRVFDPHPTVEQFAAVPAGRAEPVAMSNVVAYRPGTQPGLIAVIAHHDGPGGDNAANSGLLSTLARTLSGFSRRRGIVLVSTDGGTTGGQGAAYFAAHWPLARRIVAAIVVTSPAGASGSPLTLLTRSQEPVGPSPTLVATAAATVSQYAGNGLAVPGFVNQLVGYAIPFAETEQGPLLARRVPAVALAAGPPDGRSIGVAQLDGVRLGRAGTTVANLVAALDQAPTIDSGGPPLIVMSSDRFLPAPLAEVTLAVLIAPALTALLDMVARLRRRRIALAPGLIALAWRSSTWLVGLAAIWLVSVLPGHALPSVANPPLPGRSGASTSGILLAVAVALLYWRFVVRPRLRPAAPVAGWERTGGLAAGLLGLGFATLLLLAVNPFAVIVVLPAVHAWLWLPAASRGGRRGAVAAYLAGLAGPVLVLIEMGTSQGLGWSAPRALVAAVASGYQSPALSICFALAAAAAAQVASTLAGRYAPPHPPG